MTLVVLVGMFDSVHFAGWLKHFAGMKVTFYLFPSSPHRRLHSDVRELAENFPQNFVLPRHHIFLGLPAWLIDRFLGDYLRSVLLSRLLRRIQPKFAHALEIQHAGYLLSKARKRLESPSFSTVLTNYGSDIYWFRQFPAHLRQLVELLDKTDYYLAECTRDIDLARELGYSGPVSPVFPNSGGFDRDDLPKLAGETRRTIAIKGYHGWVGRAKTALDSLELISREIREYQIVVYSANLVTQLRAFKVKRRTGLDIQVFKKGKLSREEMGELFMESAAYVGVSLSDGISTSMLEAMAFGAIPVQTATSCCNEWFESSGVALREISAQAVAAGILEALALSEDPKHRLDNQKAVLDKAAKRDVAENALATYNL